MGTAHSNPPNSEQRPTCMSEDKDLQRQLLGEPSASKESENWRELFPEIVGRSGALALVLKLVAKIAHSNSVVLILGESGTGKELIASAIHRLSERRHK